MSVLNNQHQNLIDILRLHITQNPNKTAFIFLADGKNDKEQLTYQQLDKNARRIARYLQQYAKQNDRILLPYLPGLEFISAFMGCLYAGMVAVPAYPLRTNHHAKRLLTIIEDCRPTLILGNTASLAVMQNHPELSQYHYVLTENISEELADDFEPRSIMPSDLAFLQYTSGSTSAPKGVMVSHSNITANQQILQDVFAVDANKPIVFWLPTQHDMGLVGQLLFTIYEGTTAIFMSPTAFIEKPFLWLKAISDYQAYFSGAPNFGYQLCVDKISEEEIKQLDLTSWKAAFNGSEPVRASTLQAFSEKFASCGFTLQTSLPCYGMAETTLIISGKPLQESPVIIGVNKAALSAGRFEVDKNSKSILVSSGHVHSSYQIKIVNPQQLTLAKPGEIGEIWIAGPSVAQGYWNKPEVTEEIFFATLENDATPYLRTGDLGYLDGKELFVTGRLKDLIILQGRNIYPQDIEKVVEECDPAIRGGCTAAFSIEANEQEQLIIVAEIERTSRKIDFNPVFQAIRRAIIDTLEAVPFSIQLLAPARALKTTSGKIQRSATKAAYLAGDLTILAEDVLAMAPSSEIPSREEIKKNISITLSKILAIEAINDNSKFSDLGGTSLHAVMFHQQLQNYVGNRIELSPSIAFDYPTIQELSNYLFEQLTNPQQYQEITYKNDAPFLHEPIAIIGFSCRFPGKANSPESFWDLLKSGKDGIDTIPASRWNWQTYYDTDVEKDDKTPIKYGAFIDEIEYFDAEFFSISPKEAEAMDPQQRILLETTWHALEEAGIYPKELKGTDASVFIGATTHEYGDLLSQQHHYHSYFATGNTLSVLSGRISYALGLQGPSLTLDTACSSALVALHEACNSLHLGETGLAIVGGVNALISPDGFINLSKANMLALDGRCKVFSENADGYVRGEGVGVVILKRLSDAQKNNDNILAVIKSAIVNQDGASSGLTVPNGVAQEKLLREALGHAHLQPADIDYLEAHGTGTKLGDPMEIHAINTVYHKSHTNQAPLIIGSVKANVGHLEAAAGMAGIIKVLLSLKNEAIPQQIHVKEINSKINLHTIPAKIPQELMPWPKSQRQRRAGISSFGFSGTNAHVILEEAPKNGTSEVRSALPKTEFKRERYWLVQPEENNEIVYEWKQAILDFSNFKEFDISDGEWIIIADKLGFADELTEKLQQEGLGCHKLVDANQFSHLYERLLAENNMIAGIVDFSRLVDEAQSVISFEIPEGIKSICKHYFICNFINEINQQSTFSLSELNLDDAMQLAFKATELSTTLILLSRKSSPKNLVKTLLKEFTNTRPEKALYFNKARYVLHSHLNESSKTIAVASPDKIIPIQKITSYDQILPLVREQVLTVLGLPIDATKYDEIGLFNLGMDSLLAAGLGRRINKLFPDVTLNTTVAFDYPTIEKLSGYIEAQLTGKKKNIPIAFVNDHNMLEPIAIIGLSCRFPGGANNSEEFWQLLAKGFDGGVEISKQRWDMDEYYDEKMEAAGKIYVRRAGLLSTPIDSFDAEFFGISRREAEYLDPQQRILLEETWSAIEDARIDANTLKGSDTSVFVGLCSHDYLDLLGKARVSTEGYAGTGNSPSTAAGRISFAFGFKGPSVAIDTACSSSLVAVHQACQNLHNRESNMAIAGGVNVILNPDTMATLCQLRMLSPEGYCKTFDKDANGFMRGEGCGIIVLKRLSDAKRDGDRIYAVIKGSAVNQDGATSGLTVPNGPAQEEVIHRALLQAQLQSNDIDYIEAHGTGTSLGDPIEINAIHNVFGFDAQGNKRTQPLMIGTVKTNIGHLEAAAGIAGLIKTILALEHETIPKQLHFKERNPAIVDFNEIPAQIPLDSLPWKKQGDHIRRAGISSFGFGGTNSHVIIEEVPYEEIIIPVEIQEKLCQQEHVLVISAKTEEALEQQINDYILFFKREVISKAKLLIQDICYTSQIGRARFEKQIMVVGNTAEELLKKLEAKNYSSNEGINKLACQYSDEIKPYLRKVSLPGYSFQRKNYWSAPINQGAIFPAAGNKKGTHPLLSRRVDINDTGITLFINQISSNYPDFIADHCVFDVPVLSGPTYLSALINYVFCEKQLSHGKIEEISFYKPLTLQTNQEIRELQIHIQKQKDDKQHVSVKSHNNTAHDDLTNENWALHATMVVESAENKELLSQYLEKNLSDKINELQSNYLFYLTGKQLYQDKLLPKGVKILRHDCWIEEAWSDKKQALARVRMPGAAETRDHGYLLHPGCLDSCILLFGIFESTTIYLPYQIGEVIYSLDHEDPMWVYIEIVDDFYQQAETIHTNGYFLSSSGQIILTMRDLYLKAISHETLSQSLQATMPSSSYSKSQAAESETSKEENDIGNTLSEKSGKQYDPRQVIEIVRSQISVVLGLSSSEIDINKGFMELGMDSLVAVEFSQKLQNYFGKEIIPNAATLFNYSNITSLSAYISSYFTNEKPIVKVQQLEDSVINESIAIIGMGCRFPSGANSPEDYWKLLVENVDGIVDIPLGRWDSAKYYDPDVNAPGKMCSHRGGFLNIEIDKFDAHFFGISPREAEFVDPQHRLLLETAWEALENANICQTDLRNSRTGVYVGIWTSDYNQLFMKNGELTDITMYSGMGSSLSAAAGRISYVFGLQGPCVSIDTACSSSLVALHQACQGLQLGDCDAALVAGVNILLDPTVTIGFSQMHMLSPDGHCKTFDAAANGYVRGEGCGVIVLKRLCDAKRDKDNVLAVIKASAVNQDGASSGFTAPNGLAQERLLLETLNRAQLQAHQIDYIETHGTGTQLGDPIEVGAIKSVYGSRKDYAASPLVLGAVKSNIGHLESAAGVASVIKVVLSLQHSTIPANLHFESLNSKIDLAAIPGMIPTQPYPWEQKNNNDLRYAAISAFGATGTNAHAILAEAIGQEINTPLVALDELRSKEHLLIVSAKTDEALAVIIRQYTHYLKQCLTLKNRSPLVHDICYTSQVGRVRLEKYIAVSGKTIEELIQKLESGNYLSDEEIQSAIYSYSDEIKTHLKKVALPTYPFQRQRYWARVLDEVKAKELVFPADWYFSEQWLQAELTVSDNAKAKIPHFELVALIWDDKNQDVEYIEFIKNIEQNFLARHLSCEKLSKANLAAYLSNVVKPIGIIDASSFNQFKELTDDKLAESTQELITFYQKLVIFNHQVSNWVILSYQATTIEKSQQPTDPQQAILTHLVKVLDWQCSGVVSGIDIDAFSLDIAARVVSEVITGNEKQVSYRKDQRYVWRIEKAKAANLLSLSTGKMVIDEQANYLITGGLGGLGVALMHKLLDCGVKHIALMSRRAMPFEQKEEMERLEQHYNASIIHYQVDVADYQQLKNTLQQIDNLQGIFHLAGNEFNASLEDYNSEKINNIIKPKIAGAWYLHQLTQHLPLKNFILFSSISSLFGSSRQGPYVIANGFMDGLARYRYSLGLPITNLQWGPWAEVGMASRDDRLDLIPSSELISVEHGMNLVIQALQSPALASLGIVSPSYLRFMLGFYNHLPEWLQPFAEKNKEKNPGDNVFLQQYYQNENHQRYGLIEQLVVDQLKAVLHLPESTIINKEQGFFELGLDSLMAVDLYNSIKQKLGDKIELRPTLVFDYPSVEKISLYLQEQLSDVVHAITIVGQNYGNEAIAVVGLECIFPGDATDIDAFWQNLAQGKNAIRFTEKSRWDIERYPYKAGFINNIDKFDANFFNITPREADSMDPQQRLLLETSWRALERACINPENLNGSDTGDFIGITQSEYAQLLRQASNDTNTADFYSATGNALNVAAGRLAYYLGLQGPAMAIDTACSSSLVALHEACRSLQMNECNLAIAGGVNALIEPKIFETLMQGNMLSSDGYCKTFDKEANGYVRGEGCGIVILKRLSDAQQNNDKIFAVIKGSAVNQDGASSGLTVPNGLAQEKVIAKALANANVQPHEIDYIEAHGTGTALGDPIEIGAIHTIYGQKRTTPLIIGTVKTNIGHLESAAGIAAVIKTILSLQHEEIPRHLHFNTINPAIELNSIPAQIPLSTMAWQHKDDHIRRAGISSFGFSGTNAHVILEEAPIQKIQESTVTQQKHLLIISAHSEIALQEYIANYVSFLTNTQEFIANICYTSQTAKKEFEHKVGVIGETIVELVANLVNKQFATAEEIAITRYLDSVTLCRVMLPSYPFQKEHYWFSKKPTYAFLYNDGNHPFLQHKLDLPESVEQYFESVIDTHYPEFVLDHQIYDYPVIAGAAYISTALSLAKNYFGAKFCKLMHIEFIEALVLEENNKGTQILVKISNVDEKGNQDKTVQIFSKAAEQEEPQLRAKMKIKLVDTLQANNYLEEIKALFPAEPTYTSEDHIEQIKKISLTLGPHFHWIESVFTKDNCTLAKMRAPQDPFETAQYVLYPGLIDSCFQSMLAILHDDIKTLAIPLTIEEFSFDLTAESPRWVYGKIQYDEQTQRSLIDFLFFSEQGVQVGSLLGVVTQKAPKEALERSLKRQMTMTDYFYETVWTELSLSNGSEQKEYQNIVTYDARNKDEQFADITPAQQLLEFMQGFIQDKLSNSRLIIITENAFSLSGETIHLNQGVLNGFIKTLILEYPELAIQQIDVLANQEIKSALEQIVNLDHHEQILAYRGGKCYAQRINKYKNSAGNSKNKMQFDADAAYIITGGLGGIGLEVARYLANNKAGRIILSSRGKPSENAQNIIAQIQKTGAQVIVYPCDIRDRKQVAELLCVANNDYPLKGIFHAAGLIDDATFDKQTRDHFEKVFAPKARGAWHLHELTQEKGVVLDYFVLFSSIASLTGSLGQSNYAAANSFLDALAYYRQQNGLVAQSINWGPWAEVGMAKELPGDQKKLGIFALRTTQALDALAIALHQPIAELGIMRINWKHFAEQIPKIPSWLKILAEKSHDTTFINQLQATPNDQREKLIKARVMQEIRKVLRFDSSQVIDENKGFFEMGMDSLMTLELKNQLQVILNQVLPNTLAFDYPTPAKITAFIVNQLNLNGTKQPKIAKLAQTYNAAEPIAIIGLSCRFPGGANDPKQLWNLLEEGYDAISEVPSSRWNLDEYYAAEDGIPNKGYTRHGAFLTQDIETFDAHFFKISPREAEMMDPRQRLLLEVTWEALENAGLVNHQLEGSNTSVFIGMMNNDYAELVAETGCPTSQTGVGLGAAVLSGRLSYFFGLQGPSVVLDTACSSSLVSVHQACQSLRLGESDLALAGGVNLMLTPSMHISCSKANMLSRVGRCQTFDINADGYVRGEGCGIIVLKRLSDAQRDGDRVFAVIKGSAVNQDGASSGLTVPNGPAQESVIKRALQQAQLMPDQIDYIEAHGTGTSLGDPIEVNALFNVFGAGKGDNKRNTPLIIGSVKTNIGHTEAAAGIAGIIKTVLALQNEKIPKHLHYKQHNPQIMPFDEIPAQIPVNAIMWKKKGNDPRRAGISSFGFSGTNSHVIIEEAPLQQECLNKESTPKTSLLLISAKTEKALQQQIESYKNYLKTSPYHISDIAYSSQVGRNHFRYRIAVIGESHKEIHAKLMAGDYYQDNKLGVDNNVFPELFDYAKEWFIQNNQGQWQMIMDINVDKYAAAVEVLSWLYTKGYNMDWKYFSSSYKERVQQVLLPTYAFRRKRYWIKPITGDIDSKEEKLSDNRLSQTNIALISKNEIDKALLSGKNLLMPGEKELRELFQLLQDGKINVEQARGYLDFQDPNEG